MTAVNTIFTIWLREVLRFSRDRARIVGNLATPLIWLGIMGVGLGSAFSVPNYAGEYINFVVPGILGMTILFTSIFAGISVIWDKQFGFLKEMLVAPVSRTSIAIGKIIGSTTVSLINSMIFLLIIFLVGKLDLANLSISSVFLALILMALTSAGFVSLGLAIASKLNSMEGFQVLMSFLVMPMFLLSGAFFPMTNVPIWMKVLAHIDPLMYGVDGLRAVFIGVSEYPVGIDIAALVGFTSVMVLTSGYLFGKMGVK